MMDHGTSGQDGETPENRPLSQAAMSRDSLAMSEEDDQTVDVLIVAPHPDDAELGLGGSIVTMLRQGWTVGVLDLTDGEPTPFGSRDIRRRETEAATAILGLSWRENLGLPNRQLMPTLEARQTLANVVRRTRPRWLFAPYWVDAHPDHAAATELVEGARFWAKLTRTDEPGQMPLLGTPHHPARVFYYDCVHLRLAHQPTAILDISDVWEIKEASIRCFESQFLTGRDTNGPTLIDRLRESAAHWGRLIGTRYGEPIFSREPLGLSGFRELV